MNKIKCSNGCVYSRTMNQIYPRLCVNCGGRELVSLDQKWRSPTGASIANHETDHIPDGGRMVSKTMNDLKTVRDALESAKTFLGQTVYVRGYGEQQYSEVCVALSILDRMIETPAPTETLATESEQLRKENEELKAKLDKAIKAVEVPSDMVDADLMFCLQKFDNIPYKTVQEIARATADIIAQRSRTTLEEI